MVSIADLHGSSFVAPNSYASPGKGSAETLQGKQQLTHALHAVTETHCNDLQIQRGKLTIYTPCLEVYALYLGLSMIYVHSREMLPKQVLDTASLQGS